MYIGVKKTSNACNCITNAILVYEQITRSRRNADHTNKPDIAAESSASKKTLSMTQPRIRTLALNKKDIDRNTAA